MEPKAYSYIRFSTPEQAKGDSERRQIESSEKYAKDQKIELVPLRDEGISGHSGKHITKGELGKFLSKIKKGEIVPDSKLIIESIDRLTRLKPSEAQKLLLSILDARISLVVLDYGAREITLEKYNNEPGVFYQLMGEIQRAYQESNRKSNVLSDTRDRERDKARNGKRKISGMPPMWLKFNDDYTDFIEQKDIVEVIKMMFQMKLNGKGSYMIERELNQMDDIYFPESKRNKAGKWRKSTINRYLKDRRLIGEFQPHKCINKEDGTRKRVKAGDPIPDYYPEVIKPDLFDRVQAILHQNSRRPGNTGGRTGKVNNLFQHLVKCGKCGDAMNHDSKGKWEYLRCDSNDRDLGCDAPTVRYDSIVEPLLLQYCRGLEVSDILPGNDERRSRLAVFQNQMQAVEGELSEVENKLENLVDKIEAGEEILLRYNKRKDQRDKLQEQKSEIQEQIKKLNDSKANTAKRLQDVQDLIDRLGKLEGEERINLRLNVRGKLQSLIERLEVGFGTLREEGQQFTTFEIYFKDGVRRTLVLIDDKLDEVITLDKGDIDVQDIQRERQRESNRKVKINDPRTEK